MIAGLAFLLISQAQLPMIDLGGVRTPVTIPQWFPDPVGDSTFTADGWTYHAQGGNLTHRTRSTGDWAEVTSLGAQATSPTTVKWPMKIFVAAQLDQISQTEYGFWMPRKYVIDFDELKGVRQEVALFCHMARTYTGGRVEIEPDFEVDQEIRLLPPDQKADEALMDSLRGRLITSQGYRSCLAISSELDFQPTSRVIGNVPTTFIPFYSSFDLLAPGQLARVLFNSWTEQLQASAKLEGFEIASAPLRLPERGVGRTLAALHDPADAIRGPIWDELADGHTPNVDRNRPEPSGTGQPWSAVADNPWVKLPYLSPARLKAMGLEVAGTDSGARIGDKDFNFSESGSLVAGNHLWVQDRYADIFGAKLAGKKAIGFIAVGGRVLVAFEGDGVSGNDLAILGQTAQPVGAEAGEMKTTVPFDANEAEKLPTSGYFLVKTIVDNDRGAVGELRQFPRPRNGWVRLLGYGNEQVMFDAAKTPYLEFWVKASLNPQPLDLVTVSAGKEKRFRLFGRSPRMAAVASKPRQGVDLQITADGTWQKIVIDLKAGDSAASQPISSVYLAVPPESAYWSPPNPILPILFDDLKVTETASQPAAAVKSSTGIAAIAEASDPFSRAAWAATVADDPAKLRTLINDKDFVVMLNALIRFGDRKDPATVPALVSIARTFLLRPSRLAYDALAVQDSDEAWTAISNSLTQGPFDINKREGARLIVQKNKDAKLTGQISLLFVSPSWETRRQASIALSKLDGDPAKIVSLSFVNGTEAAIREASINVADVSVPLVCDRLLSMMDPLNEPSDYLRALAALKLLSSGKEKYVTPTWKLLPNLTPAAMAVFLDRLPPTPEYRDSVFALATGNPQVTSAVLRWLGRAGGVTEADLAKLGEASDPMVFLTLLDLRNKKQATVPATWEQRMRQSRDYRVREQLGNE